MFLHKAFRYKYIIVIRKERNLRDILVSTIHDSYIEDHNNIYNSYKNLKSILYKHSIKILVKKRFVNECNVYKQAKLERVAYPSFLQPLSTL